ncbi:MAG: M48 family metallopeptidase [Candidatus Limnocylindrales bacterium]
MSLAPTQSFYSEIAQNRRQSALLVLVMMLVLALLGLAVGYGVTGDWQSGLLVMAGGIVLAGLLSLGSYFGGDSLVLGASRAQEVDDQSAPQLMNVVRELTVAADLPMPRVYIINDPAPNAFATGRDPQHASVAITVGLLQKLDREQLQGVIGHELSHVRNLDTRYMLLVGVLVGSIALIADVFLRFTFWGGMGGGRRSDSSGGGGGAQAIILLVALVLAIVAPIFGALVQLAVSRQREYLADASSVELTRNPVGLEQALAKIAADPEPLEVANRATQHLYIVNPLKKHSEVQNLMSTHPPILDRINRLRALTGQPPLDAVSAQPLAGLD